MKSFLLCVALLFVGAFASAEECRAGCPSVYGGGFSGFSGFGGYPVGVPSVYAPIRRTYSPYVRTVPVNRRVFIGYDTFGRPVFRQVSPFIGTSPYLSRQFSLGY